MDPNATLKEIREILNDRKVADNADLDRLADCVEDLDHWLVRGGFLPEPWERDSESSE